MAMFLKRDTLSDWECAIRAANSGFRAPCKSIWTQKNMGFCNFRGRTTEPLDGGHKTETADPSREPLIWVVIGLSGDRAVALHFGHRLLDVSDIARRESVAVLVRFDAERSLGGKSAKLRGRCNLIARQMEHSKNVFIKQWLAVKVRSRLRVICATPAGKGAQ